MGKYKFVKINEKMPLFKDSMTEDYVLPEPSEKQKELADKMCKWLFSENKYDSAPKEALQFIEFMKIAHENL